MKLTYSCVHISYNWIVIVVFTKIHNFYIKIILSACINLYFQECTITYDYDCGVAGEGGGGSPGISQRGRPAHFGGYVSMLFIL